MEAFHEILEDLLSEKGLNKNTASKYFKKHGLDIERNVVSTYVNCAIVPNFMRAKEIMNILEYEISDEQLKECLVLSKQTRRSQRYGNDKYFVMGIKIPFSKLSSVEKNPLKVELMLKNRMDEVNGVLNGRGTASYIKALIRADLDYGLLDEILMEENKK